MGGNAAHGVEGDGTADHPLVPAPGPVGPWLLDDHVLLEGGMGQLGGDAANGLGRKPSARSDGVGAVLLVQVTLGQDMKRWPGASPVGKGDRTLEARRRILAKGGSNGAVAAIPAQRVAVLIAGETAVLGAARIVDHQPPGVGIAAEIFDIHLAGAQQLVDQGQDEQPVGPWRDRQPFIGDGRIAGPDRVDGDELDAFLLQFAEPDLDGIGIVILGDAEHHEIAGVFPVGLAELPERPADGIDAGGGHVDRTEPPVGGIVGGAELLRPPRGQGLALVAAGEEGELVGIGGAAPGQPCGGDVQRLVPLDLLEFAAAPFADTLQGLGQARRRIQLHDAGRTLGAQHALIHRMVAVALDEADGAVAQIDLYAATAGAHVTRGGLDFVRDLGRSLDFFLLVCPS